MTSPDAELRTMLQTLSLGATVYDRVPEGAAWPYIHISDISGSDMFTADRTIWDVELLLDIVTGYPTISGGRKEADTIGNAVLTALCDTPYRDLGTYQIVKTTILNSNYIDEDSDSGYIVRKLMRFSLQISETDPATDTANPVIVSAIATVTTAIDVTFSKAMDSENTLSDYAIWVNGDQWSINTIGFITTTKLRFTFNDPIDTGDVVKMAITSGLLASDGTVFQGATFEVTNLI